MSCSQCCGIEVLFDEKKAKKELNRFHKKGEGKATKLLIQEVLKLKQGDQSLLDIGGGIGAIQFGLIEQGINNVTNVDGSSGYQKINKEEANRKGVADIIKWKHGDMTVLADQINVHDIVTLDKVICCYPNMEELLGSAVERSRHLVGLVYPKKAWWTKLFRLVGNVLVKFKTKYFNMYLHNDEDVEKVLDKNGFILRSRITKGFWQIRVYEKA